MTPKTREQQARELAEKIAYPLRLELEEEIIQDVCRTITQALLSFPPAEAVSDEELRKLSKEYQERLSAADNYTQHDLEIQGRAFRVGFRAGQKKMEGGGK